jgi:FAD:protein FMN transferase
MTPVTAVTAAAAARDTFGVFGTTATLLVTEPTALAAARRLADAELAAVDLACSRFRADSELSALNAAAGASVPISELFAELLAEALRAARLTDGAVDPTCGGALAALGYDRDFSLVKSSETAASGTAPGAPGTPASPDTTGTASPRDTTAAPGTAGTPGTPGTAGTAGSRDTLGTAGTSGTPGTLGTAGTPGTPGTAGTAGTPGAAGTPGTLGTAGTAGTPGTPGTAGTAGTPGSPVPGWRNVLLGSDPPRARLTGGAQLDLGATAKARAADRAAEIIARQLGCGVLVSLGGDIAVAGPAPAGGWQVRVTDDHAAGSDAPGQTVAISSGGLATSSTTVRAWARGGRRMHHIVDPATGEPARSCWRTVSVAAGSCTDANIACTAAIIRGASALAWLGDLALPARLVRENGSVQTTAGWPHGPGPRPAPTPAAGT